MNKKIITFVNERTYELMEEKAKRCDMLVPDLARELLQIGVGEE